MHITGELVMSTKVRDGDRIDISTLQLLFCQWGDLRISPEKCECWTNAFSTS